MATQPQKDQFIALAAVKLKLETLDKIRFQTFLDDPEGLDRFANEFIATYERRTYPPVPITALPADLQFPDWSKGLILKCDIRRPQEINFPAVTASPYFHPRQTGDEHKENRPSGHEILASLVASYKVGEDKKENTYDVAPSDAIHGHFGLPELTYMEKNWSDLPAPFKTWAKGKLLYGWRDVVRRVGGYLLVPYLSCGVDRPDVRWYRLDSSWYGYEPGLRERVGAQA